MAYKREDGRKLDECRPMEAKTGVVPNADGSAMFKIGKTIAIAVVRGPRQLHPRFLQNPEKGVLRCNYNMMAFSGAGDRVRPGPSRRSKEISYVTTKALEPVLDLSKYPNAVIDVFVELIQTDAGTRCAGIVAASMALADAGIPMKDLVSAVAVGVIDGTVVADVDKAEEDYEGGMGDIPLAYLPRNEEISLLQLDGDVSVDELKKGLEIGKKACQQIYEIQKKALKERFGGSTK